MVLPPTAQAGTGESAGTGYWPVRLPVGTAGTAEPGSAAGRLARKDSVPELRTGSSAGHSLPQI